MRAALTEAKSYLVCCCARRHGHRIDSASLVGASPAFASDAFYHIGIVVASVPLHWCESLCTCARETLETGAGPSAVVRRKQLCPENSCSKGVQLHPKSDRKAGCLSKF